MSEWLLQRLTAIVMALYALVCGLLLLVTQPEGYAGWHRLFASQAVKAGTLLFILSLLLHAWLGVQSVLADYVQSPFIRRMLQAGAFLLLAGLVLWTLRILWGSAA